MSDEQDKATEETTLTPLNTRQEVFVSEYLQCWNGTAAYLVAYPNVKKRETARAAAARLLANVSVKEAIRQRLDELHMSADEALKLLTDIARGDIGEAVNEFGAVDLAELHRQGKTRLIKKVRQKTVTKIGKSESDEDVEVHDTELEFYPADSALRDILKIHGKYKDEVNINIAKPVIIEVIKSVEAKE